MTSPLTSLTELAKAADQCVRCGLCLPHCPTYGVLREEADSPRGRIALIQGLAEGKLSVSAPLVEHLDRCLLCRSCEHVCPAKVPFHGLMIGAREKIGESGYARKPVDGRVERLLERSDDGKLASWLRLAYQTSGLQWLARRSNLLPAELARAEGYLPPPTALLETRERYDAVGAEIGRVGLFAGCMGRDFDALTLKSAIRLLTAYGYAVVMPSARTCCGALHLHQGDIPKARDQAREALAVFSGLGVDAVIVASSACCATLADAAETGEQAPPVLDICRFVAECAKSAAGSGRRVTFRPAENPVAVHIPCSQAHALRDQTSITEILNLIPGIELKTLPSEGGGSVRCCGGAGRYVFDQPALSDRIRERTLDDIADVGADTVVTTNLGCALHIGKGLRESGVGGRVMHPVTLLAERLI
ncbi:MAG: 4Fe-4S dicluster domain-containing protein [Gammaproteobacteria bacterium]|nr:4Fe-4S dicluster domain-containing protein [Gammaproteobacteria bacterium]